MTKTALITGASRGLGASIAKALAQSHHVIAVARTTGALEELDDVIQSAGGQTTLAPMDITVDAAMQQLCRSIFDRWGSLDLWFHPAIHAAPLCPAGHVGEKDLTKSLDINVSATARLIRYLEPLLGKTGQAVFFEDAQGGSPFFGTYGSTKSAQIALAKSWQAETQRTGPKVHILSPNPMPTATRARFHPSEDKANLSSPETEAARLLAQLS